MKKKISYSSITILLLAVAVVVMSIGFAGFSEQLKIEGTAEVGMSSWDVAFEEDSFSATTGSVEVNPGDDGLVLGNLSMSYNVTLNKPGDFYEFTINIKNSGTFNATLTGITMSALTETQKKYLTYEVTYDKTTYTESQTGLSVALNSSAFVPVKVRVAYVQPANASDLPAKAENINLNVSFDYSQAA